MLKFREDPDVFTERKLHDLPIWLRIVPALHSNLSKLSSRQCKKEDIFRAADAEALIVGVTPCCKLAIR